MQCINICGVQQKQCLEGNAYIGREENSKVSKPSLHIMKLEKKILISNLAEENK